MDTRNGRNLQFPPGREYGLEPAEMKALEFGSLLHDIGKIGVPDAILRKPAKLTDEEWVRMREHPLHGQQILRGINFFELRLESSGAASREMGWLRLSAGTQALKRSIFARGSSLSPMPSMPSPVIGSTGVESLRSCC